MLVGKTVGNMQHALINRRWGQPCCLCRLPLRYIYIVDSIATWVTTMPACRSLPTLTAAGVLSGLGVIMRPSALRIIFGLLLGVLAAFFIGALAPPTPPQAKALSSAFALRFFPAQPAWISAR
jgi:hypothetical protein